MENVFTVRLGDEEAVKVLDLCSKEDRKASAMLRILVREGLEARESVKKSEGEGRVSA